MTSLSELNTKIIEAEKHYNEALVNAQAANSALEMTKISLIRADSTVKRFQLECRARKATLDSLIEESRNIRAEARLIR